MGASSTCAICSATARSASAIWASASFSRFNSAARSILAPQPTLYALPGIADFLDRLLHSRRGSAGFLRLIADFVVLGAIGSSVQIKRRIKH